MKQQLIILGIALSLLTSACYFKSDYLGNKNVIQRSKETDVFQAIELAGSIRNLKLYFSQDSAAPFIRIEVDSNILDKVAIFVKNDKLTIKNKEEYRHLQLVPSVFNIYCNAAALTEVNIIGQSNVICKTPLAGELLEVRITGSGNFIAEQHSSITQLDVRITSSGDAVFNGNGQTAQLNLSGSGNIELQGNYANIEGQSNGSGDITCKGNVKEINLQQSGSGDLHLTGSADKANLQILGSGGVDAKHCTVKQLAAQISGSGNIVIEVQESLSAKIVGSGSILYKGNPEQENIHISGSGKVESME